VVSLEDGKTPYAIGQDLSKWLEKLFETKIPPGTIKSRAQRVKDNSLASLNTNVSKTI